MSNALNDQRIFSRARRIALEEQDAFLKSLKAMPAEFRERVAGVVIRFDERPSKEMIHLGVAPDAVSLTERDGKVIVLFLMCLYDRYGKIPGDLRRELRRVMCGELAGLAGMDWLGEQEA